MVLSCLVFKISNSCDNLKQCNWFSSVLLKKGEREGMSRTAVRVLDGLAGGKRVSG